MAGLRQLRQLLNQVRVRLRTLMLLVLVVGSALGWLVMQRERAARRQWAVQTIRAARAWVESDGTGVIAITWPGSLDPVERPQQTLSGEQLAALQSCAGLRDLTLHSIALTDDLLAVVDQAHQLERLFLFHPALTDTSLGHLANLRHLKILDLLRAPNLTDATFAAVGQLTSLEELGLDDLRITGAGFGHLAGLPHLRELTVRNTDLDDAGLAQLSELPALEKLILGRGHYTEAGLAHLTRLRHLRMLEVYAPGAKGRRIPDAWVDQLASIRSLEAVLFTEAKVSENAIQRWRRVRPDTQLWVNSDRQ